SHAISAEIKDALDAACRGEGEPSVLSSSLARRTVRPAGDLQCAGLADVDEVGRLVLDSEDQVLMDDRESSTRAVVSRAPGVDRDERVAVADDPRVLDLDQHLVNGW